MIDFLATLVVVLICTWVASRYIHPFSGADRGVLWVSFVAHQVAGIVNIAVTRFYYEWGDMMSYYRFGVFAAERLRQNFWDLAPGFLGLLVHSPDPLAVPLPIEALPGNTGSIQALSAFAMLATDDSLYATCALIAGAAFLSKVCLFKVVSEELPDLPRRPLLILCVLLPSALFWSCSLIKESFAMIGVLCALYGWHLLSRGRDRLRATTMLLGGSVAIILIKGYIFPAFVLAAVAWHVARKVHERRGDVTFKAGHIVIAGVAAAAMVAATGALLPQFGADALGDQLANLQAIGATGDGGSDYTLGKSAGSAGSQAALAPLGLLTALFRPVIVEVKTPIVLLGALEMSFFLLAAVVVPFRRSVLSCFSELLRRPFLSFCAVFVLVFGTCVGLGTTNLGTLSRYRMPLTPFFGILLLALLARDHAPLVVRRPVRRRSGEAELTS